MPQVSRRGAQIIHSPIRSLIPYARKAKSEGVKVYHLNIGQPDIKTPAEAIESLKDYKNQVIEYGASEGTVSLRNIVASYYCENVAPIQVEDIYVTTGASEGILFTLFSCFDEGAEIIIPEPFYANYIGFSQVSAVQLVPVTSRIEDDFGLPDIDDIVSKITAKTKAIFLCNPGNPTGNHYSKADLIALAEVVIEHDLFLVVDEVYREFCYDEPFYSVLKIDTLRNHVIVIDSISKVFSACGSRIGFIVSKNTEVMENILKFAQLRLCPPMIGQVVAQACFENRTNYLSQVKSEYDERRKYLYNRLSNIHGVKCYLPRAAFYIMTELPVDDANHFCKWLLSDFRLNGETVMLAPGQGFYMSPGIGRSQVRIAFVLGIAELQKCMDILEAGLEEYQSVLVSEEEVRQYN